MKLLRQRGQFTVGRIDLDVVLSVGMGVGTPALASASFC
jgi:hypothetical protein